MKLLVTSEANSSSTWPGVLPEGGGSVAMAGLALLADRLPADFLMVMRPV